MRRRATVPRLTVVLAVEGAPEYVSRAIESVQGQDIHDIQFVIVASDVAPGVAHSLSTFAERDIHIDLIDADGSGVYAALQTGFSAARGAYVVFMRAYDWFAPKALADCLELALDHEADIVFPTVSLDRYDVHRERHSRLVGEESFAFSGHGELQRGLSTLIESGLVTRATGVLFRHEVLDGLAMSATTPSELGLTCCAIAGSKTVCGDSHSIFHTSIEPLTDAFDPSMFSRACADAQSLKGLLESFDVDASSDTARACERVVYRALVACIENLCLSPHSISSIERNARIKDMLGATRTREMVASLKSVHRDLGIMFPPIAAAKPLSCIMRSHVADFLNLSMNKIA